jgi:parvulin-like peptidyl-prolyl isomerase
MMNVTTRFGTLTVLFLGMMAAQAAQNRSNLFDKPKAAGSAPLFSDTIVAKGKGFEIKQSQVDEMFLAFKGHRAAIGQAVPEAARSQIEADILDKLIATQLFLRRSTDQDKAKAKEIADSFIADQKKQAPSEESFRRQLLAVGMTPAEFESQIREQAIVKAVIDREIKANKSVTDQEIRSFYTNNANLFREPELVRVSHILISTRDSVSGKEFTPEIKLEKRRRAEQARARAKAGEDFTKLVREFSEDARSKEHGGEYRFARAKDDPSHAMVPEFEAAAFSMAPNQISDIVETGFGYHVIKTLEKIPSKTIELSKVQDRIKDTLLREAVERELPAYLEKMKKEAGVEILVAEYKK